MCKLFQPAYKLVAGRQGTSCPNHRRSHVLHACGCSKGSRKHPMMLDVQIKCQGNAHQHREHTGSHVGHTAFLQRCRHLRRIGLGYISGGPCADSQPNPIAWSPRTRGLGNRNNDDATPLCSQGMIKRAVSEKCDLCYFISLSGLCIPLCSPAV